MPVKEERICLECQKPFITKHSAQRCCTRACGRTRDTRIKNLARHTAEREAREIYGDKIDPFAVFARDRWICQLCGEKTPRKLRGTYDSRAPELDHIVPLAAGGPHTWANVQCACRACNAAKNDKPLGQMRLFG